MKPEPKCKHKITGAADWFGKDCPYCEVAEMQRQVKAANAFVRAAAVERDRWRDKVLALEARVAQLLEELSHYDGAREE